MGTSKNSEFQTIPPFKTALCQKFFARNVLRNHAVRPAAAARSYFDTSHLPGIDDIQPRSLERTDVARRNHGANLHP